MATVDKSRIKKDEKTGRHYIIVESHDTLSEIAEAWCVFNNTEYQGETSWKPLVTLNQLTNPNYILPGWTIWLDNGSNTTDPPPAHGATDQGAECPTVLLFGVPAGTDNPNRIYAVWICHPLRDYTETFETEWRAHNKLGFWPNEYRKDEDIDVDRQVCFYDLPDDNLVDYIEFRVRPISKTYEASPGVEKTYFNSKEKWTDWGDCRYYVAHKPPTPGQVDVKLQGLNLTVSIETPDVNKVSFVQFQLIQDNNYQAVSDEQKIKVSDSSTVVSYTFQNLDAGHTYSVRARTNKDNLYSEWSSLSSTVETQPATPTLDDPEVKSSTTIYVSWSASNTAEGYVLQYTSDPDGFYEGVSFTEHTPSSKDSTNYTVSVEKGKTYSFRVKAKKGAAESAWSEVKTATIGSTPTSPTTWSSTTTAVVGQGESVALYWMHNATDGSSQTSAEVKLTIDGISNLNSIIGSIVPQGGIIKDTQAILLYYKLDYDSQKRLYTETNETVTIDTSSHTPLPSTFTNFDRRVYKIKVEDVDVYYCIHNILVCNFTADTAVVQSDGTTGLVVKTDDVDIWSDGARITWNVETTSSAGMTSDPSADRVVQIFTKPEVTMSVSNETSSDLGIIYYKVEYLTSTNTYNMTTETLAPLNGSPIPDAFTVNGDHQVRSGTVDGETIYYCVVEDDSIDSLPIKVRVKVSVNEEIQRPVEYFLSIFANENYETVDNFGKQVTVSTGQTLFSKHYITSSMDPLYVDISAGDVSLENGQDYTIKCVVAMSSGLTAEAFTEVHISWSASSYYLDAEIGYDEDQYSTFIRPYCQELRQLYHIVEKVGSLYFVTDTTQSYIYGTPVSNTKTATGEQVYEGYLSNGTQTYFTIVNHRGSVIDVLLSIYRREYDGTFTPIVVDIDAADNSFVTDPHPSLDYARYRIVAKDKRTSAVSYSDINNYYIGEKAIIIQWGEPMTTFEVSEYSLSSSTPKESFLRLPYNIDVTNTRDPDVSLVEYIGRKHPVTYYGTQVGEAANWSTTIPKYDVETIYALQRLQAYSGDVYVREPNGTGYWANVKVSFSKNHLETTVPISIDVIRVEGGV